MVFECTVPSFPEFSEFRVSWSFLRVSEFREFRVSEFPRVSLRYARGKAVRMSIRNVVPLLGCAIAFLSTVYAVDRSVPRAYREYPGVEYNVGDIPLPPD